MPTSLNNNNSLANYHRFLENLERTRVRTDRDREILKEIRKAWDNEMIERPQIFMKYFSDDPKLMEEAKREIAEMLYKMEHPS